jgi:hypothetical protein
MCYQTRFGLRVNEYNRFNRVMTDKMELDLISYLDATPNLFIPIEDLGLTIEQLNDADNYSIVTEDDLQDDSIHLAASKIIKLYRYISNDYASGIAPNTRPFCKQMVRRTDLALMPMESIVALNSSNPGFGIGGSDSYSVFNWRGGVNCKHFWVKYLYQVDTKNIVKDTKQPDQQDKGKVPNYNKE